MTVKVRTNLLKERGIVALLFEASSLDDADTLEHIRVGIGSREGVECSYTDSLVLLAHVRGLPADLFQVYTDEKENSNGQS